MSYLPGYNVVAGLPKGITYSDGILKIEPDKSSHHVGMEAVGLFKIDNKYSGTDSNLCLESSDADYLIKESPTYITVNEDGLDETYNVYYVLDEENKTCVINIASSTTATYAIPNIRSDSIVRKLDTIEKEYIYYKIIKISDSAFFNPRNSNLLIDAIPDTVTEIGHSAFHRISRWNGKTLVFPSNLVSIRQGAFLDSCNENDGICDFTKINTRSLSIETSAFKSPNSKCTIKMTQDLATSLGDRIVNGKIDDVIVEIVTQEETL